MWLCKAGSAGDWRNQQDRRTNFDLLNVPLHRPRNRMFTVSTYATEAVSPNEHMYEPLARPCDSHPIIRATISLAIASRNERLCSAESARMQKLRFHGQNKTLEWKLRLKHIEVIEYC